MSNHNNPNEKFGQILGKLSEISSSIKTNKQNQSKKDGSNNWATIFKVAGVLTLFICWFVEHKGTQKWEAERETFANKRAVLFHQIQIANVDGKTIDLLTPYYKNIPSDTTIRHLFCRLFSSYNNHAITLLVDLFQLILIDKNKYPEGSFSDTVGALMSAYADNERFIKKFDLDSLKLLQLYIFTMNRGSQDFLDGASRYEESIAKKIISESELYFWIYILGSVLLAISFAFEHDLFRKKKSTAIPN